MLYCKINSCLLYNSQTNMLNEILCHLYSKRRVWVLCYFSPFMVLIFQCTQTFLVAFHLRPCNFHLGL